MLNSILSLLIWAPNSSLARGSLARCDYAAEEAKILEGLLDVRQVFGFSFSVCKITVPQQLLRHATFQGTAYAAI